MRNIACIRDRTCRHAGDREIATVSEYLQNATELREDLFACIDIHRSSLWLMDVKRRRYRGIKFPVEWSMHDVTSLGRNINSA